MLCRTCVFASGGSASYILHSSAFGARNIDALFSWLGVDRYGYDKKWVWTCYAKLVFLYPVGFMSHVVHYGASGAQNINALFFMLGWDRYGYDKKCVGTRYAEPMFFCIQWDLWVM
jgi:hypothetical protein